MCRDLSPSVKASVNFLNRSDHDVLKPECAEFSTLRIGPLIGWLPAPDPLTDGDMR